MQAEMTGSGPHALHRYGPDILTGIGASSQHLVFVGLCRPANAESFFNSQGEEAAA